MKESVQYLIQKDKIFQQIIDEFGFPEIIPSRPEGFETLVLLILEQQVSIDSAKATFLRMRNGVANIQPSVLIAVSEEEFRAFGVSRQKAKYIKCLSEAILDKSLDLESLASKSSDEIRSELIKIKGIGNWTIDVYLMFSLQSPDVLPIGDVAIVNTMKELLNIHDKMEMEAYATLWSPHRTMASFLLWHHYLQKRGRKITYQY
ncbi:DNA-3-methyladenine glycosylase 2 family protein [Flavobacterium amnicola]|uniref:DNA-3-methyladenine glycosylase II n=1 Tax=Flavobacterium amnicola TaxID=2506422 RepID=A0A4Q1K775_9FLAO|nr:DNA-3-methyladenine glycosylase [Flavobacterium amnicola]RXR21325.1 DNA-3-methyladenine glycosylase 2 family protein [Flavobacterium amnicola]